MVDGRLDDPIYEVVPAIDGFVQQLPDEGAPATEPTELWLLFDDDNVYVSARCWDSQPERMVANEMTRDARAIWRNDSLSVLFDTFHDRRNGMSFTTTPLGGLLDNIVTDERDVNLDWNTVWDAQTSVFEHGWMVEMVIPFKSLRFQAGGAQIWGVNVSRRIQWKNETTFLSPVPASLDRLGMLQVSAAATLVGIEPPTTLRNLEIKPYAISGTLTDRDATPVRSNDVTGDIGLDLKYGLTRSLIADFTVNTDFAQVEADERQVNLTRFSLFFPEKREFFLEGQGIFAFGDPVAGTRRQNVRPSDTPVLFFSRRIGLEDGEQVPILAGGRVTGRAGAYSVGLLNIQTGDSATADAISTNFSVVRLKRDILRRSNVGVIYTRRSQLLDADGVNQVYGADLNFRFYENVSLSSYYARTDTLGLEGSDASYRGKFEYTGDRYGIEVEHLTVDEQFNPEIGFVRRDDFRRNFAQLRFSPRPRAIPWLRRLIYQGSFDYITDTPGTLETREGKLRFEMELENSDKWHVEYTDSFEGLQEDFEIADDVVLPIVGVRTGQRPLRRLQRRPGHGIRGPSAAPEPLLRGQVHAAVQVLSRPPYALSPPAERPTIGPAFTDRPCPAAPASKGVDGRLVAVAALAVFVAQLSGGAFQLTCGVLDPRLHVSPSLLGAGLDVVVQHPLRLGEDLCGLGAGCGLPSQLLADAKGQPA